MNMLKTLNSISFKKIVWIFPIVHLFHELEEWFIFEWWAIQFPDSIVPPVVEARIFLVVVSLLMFCVYGLMFLFKDPKKMATGILIASTVTFANGFQHLYWTFGFNLWSPGTFFASFIAIPVSIYIAWRAVSEGLVKKRLIIMLIVVSILILIDTIISGNQVPLMNRLINDGLAMF